MAGITKNTVVTLDYTVTDIDGMPVDEGQEPLSYLHGGYDDVFPQIEAALEGKSAGDSIIINLQPAEAFGEYDADLVRIESVDAFNEEVKVGMQLEQTENGHDLLFTVTDVAEGKVVLDGNHPLAGMALVFEGTVISVRPASEREIRAGKSMATVR
ncbi:peptidylprolyl isomerase [Trichlorobacter lovleyi]|uniref:FKBP-type peptidyl-prolyl cis-trans isomerase n=1 Tax=Trichlorobacter lovleyi TaxID=313985 RepID=UPI00223FAA05|nr:peptidylprolyl isomerase [Trichlorobacter lovleyi]QOX79357.1 peptidylprolyl isomerase [Trichlorobacter lovleyi]